MITEHEFRAMSKQMVDDVRLTGDVLLFALLLLDQQIRQPTSKWSEAVSEAAGKYPGWAKHIVSSDVPKHVPIEGPRTCVGPMVRRDVCGKRGTQHHVLHDLATDTATELWSCGHHHREVEAMVREGNRAWVAAGAPRHQPNSGGVLPTYFRGNWVKIYTWAAPWWKPHPAGVYLGGRPKLTLIRGGLDLIEDEGRGV